MGGSRPSKTPPKFHEKTPRERQKERNGGKRRKRAKFWAAQRRVSEGSRRVVRNEDARLRPIRLRPAGRNRIGRSRNWPKSNRWCLLCFFFLSFLFCLLLCLFTFLFFFLVLTHLSLHFVFVLFLFSSPEPSTPFWMDPPPPDNPPPDSQTPDSHPPDSPPPDNPKFRAFFSLLPPQFSFFSLSWGPFVEFWWCLKRWGPEMCTFGLGLSCGTLAAPPDRDAEMKGDEAPTFHMTLCFQRSSLTVLGSFFPLWKISEECPTVLRKTNGGSRVHRGWRGVLERWPNNWDPVLRPLFHTCVSTRAGSECVAHVIQGLTVVIDQSSRAAMMDGLCSLCGGEVVPFVRFFHGSPIQLHVGRCGRG